MAKVITFGIQKGGSSKTTTTVITAYLMAEEGYRVLVVDTDSQANATDALTQKPLREFEGKTLLQAVREQDVYPFLHATTHENIDLLASDDFLATLPRFLYQEYRSDLRTFLKDLLHQVEDDYDYILIDTPPSLNELTTNAITAADYVVVLAESSKWAALAIDRFLETVAYSKMHINTDTHVLGILMNLIDVRRSDNNAIVSAMQKEYEDVVFTTTIKRKATTGRLSLYGLHNNDELRDAVEPYENFYQELKERIQRHEQSKNHATPTPNHAD